MAEQVIGELQKREPQTREQQIEERQADAAVRIINEIGTPEGVTNRVGLLLQERSDLAASKQKGAVNESGIPRIETIDRILDEYFGKSTKKVISSWGNSLLNNS